MTETKTKYPSAIYAAAGVGDLVYEQLRKLQGKAVAFGSEQAPQWKRKVADLSTKVDANRVRESVVTSTQFAAQKATEVYDTLVARGEKAFADEAPKTEAPKTEAPKTQEQTTPAAKKAVPVAKKAEPRKRTAV